MNISNMAVCLYLALISFKWYNIEIMSGTVWYEYVTYNPVCMCESSNMYSYSMPNEVYTGLWAK